MISESKCMTPVTMRTSLNMHSGILAEFVAQSEALFEEAMTSTKTFEGVGISLLVPFLHVTFLT